MKAWQHDHEAELQAASNPMTRTHQRVTMPQKKLTRTDGNFWLDVFLLLLFIALCTCSVIVEFVFPPGTEADGWLLWGKSYSEWSRIQFAMIATLAAGVLLHVTLHWGWVCGVVVSRLRGKQSGKAVVHDDPYRTLWGVGLLILVVNVVGLVVAAAVLTIQSTATGP
jgi:hypothetical protein